MNIDFGFVPNHYAPRTHDKMTDVLMDPKGKGPSIHYYMIRGSSKQKNITVWEPGTVSGEYIKTYGHYHVGEIDETYWILHGEGVALLQKLEIDISGDMIADSVEEFKAFSVRPGASVHIPPNYGHVFSNVGDTFLVTADDTLVIFDEEKQKIKPPETDYEMVKKMRGFAYYVVEHKGKPALKKNDHYKEVLKTDFGDLPVI